MVQYQAPDQLQTAELFASWTVGAVWNLRKSPRSVWCLRKSPYFVWILRKSLWRIEFLYRFGGALTGDCDCNCVSEPGTGKYIASNNSIQFEFQVQISFKTSRLSSFEHVRMNIRATISGYDQMAINGYQVDHIKRNQLVGYKSTGWAPKRNFSVYRKLFTNIPICGFCKLIYDFHVITFLAENFLGLKDSKDSN